MQNKTEPTLQKDTNPKAQLQLVNEQYSNLTSFDLGNTTGLSRINKMTNILMDREQQSVVLRMPPEIHTAWLQEINRYPIKTEEEIKYILTVLGYLYREFYKVQKELKNGTITVKYEEIEYENLAQILTSVVHIKKIAESFDDNVPLFLYNVESGIYENFENKIEQMIRWIQPGIKINSRKEVLAALKQDCQFQRPTRIENLAVLKNGIFDTNSKTLIPFSPRYVFITKTNAIYPSDHEINGGMPEPVFDNNGKPWTFTQFLNDITESDESVIYLIKQMMQYSLLTNKAKNAFFMLYSELGRTGKGTLTECLTSLIGRDNTGMADLEQIEGQYTMGSLYNKAMWASNEFDGRFVKSSSILKNASTGDAIPVESKGKQPFYAICYPLIIQSMNHKPRFGNKMDNSTQNRARVIGFHKTFINEDNTDIKNKFIVSEELNKWLTYNLLQMPVEPIIDTAESIMIKGEIAKDSNPVLQWYEEFLSQFESQIMPFNLIYRNFVAWSQEEKTGLGYRKSTFKNDLLSILGPEWEIVSRVQPRKFAEADYKLFFESTFEGITYGTSAFGTDAVYTTYETYKKAVLEKSQTVLRKKSA